MAKETSLLVLVLFGFCLHEIAAIPSFAAECLREHNEIRKKHGARPLEWDPTLAAHAQKWADNLNERGMSMTDVHELNSEGENIAMLSYPNCKEALEEWTDEAYDYNDLGYCANTPRVPMSYVWHFTQVVWKSTRKVGVGISGIYLVARYKPAGNSHGQFGKNVQC